MKTCQAAAKDKNPVPIHLLILDNLPIFEQLQIEEALLRADQRNWCVMNRGSSPAIVMGISGKPELLIHRQRWHESPVPLIRRFSGGGTVFVDSNTQFVTWICNAEEIGTECCPAKVHCWSAHFYQQALPELKMTLRENDYVIGEKKFGGNAQYLTKGRWLHHSSLLWDYNSENMEYLLMPSKMPAYRMKRSHDAFLCRLSEHFEHRDEFEKRILDCLWERFEVKVVTIKDIEGIREREHRKATEMLDWN